MKKQIAILSILTLALTGCANSSAAPDQTTVPSQEPAAVTSGAATASASATTQNAPEGSSAVTSSGQLPSGQPSGEARGKMVRGQIQDILGNDVTLALMEMPKRPEGATDTAAAEKPKTAAPTGDPMGGPPGMGQQSREVKLTGETLAIQIPVGVPIASRGQGGDTSLQLADLMKGDILNVQYDTDGVTIIKVNVTSGSSQ